tara:strand:- start:230 stop:430 length:201 start_codon:yes stop_codon:yes gene_type:complete
MAICCICNEDIKGNVRYDKDGNPIALEVGNNAKPIANGSCCDDCHYGTVLPARLLNLRLSPSNKKE